MVPQGGNGGRHEWRPYDGGGIGTAVLFINCSGRPSATLLNLADKVREGVMRAVLRGAHFVQRAAKLNARNNFGEHRSNAPGQPSTAPSLQRSITVIPHPETFSADVGPEVIYGPIRELGGDIYPVHKRYLSWWVTDEIQGGYRTWAQASRSKRGRELNVGASAHRVFAKHVHQEGNPYLQPALDEHEAEIMQEIEEALGGWMYPLIGGE